MHIEQVDWEEPANFAARDAFETALDNDEGKEKAINAGMKAFYEAETEYTSSEDEVHDILWEYARVMQDEAFSRAIEANAKIDETGGMILTSATGTLYRNPWVAVYQESSRQVLEWMKVIAQLQIEDLKRGG